MDELGVYILTEQTTKKFYIGSTQWINKRIDRHWTDLSKGRHHNVNLQQIWNSGFRDFEVTFIVCHTRQDAYELEDKLIKRFVDDPALLNIGVQAIGGDNKTKNPDSAEINARTSATLRRSIALMSVDEKQKKFGRPGKLNGMFGRTHTAEVRKRLSERHMGHSYNKGRKLSARHVEQIRARAKARVGAKNSFYGRTHTDETKAKLSLAKKGNLPTNALKISIDGIVYNSVSAAARALGMVRDTLIFRARSKNPKFRNCFFLT